MEREFNGNNKFDRSAIVSRWFEGPLQDSVAAGLHKKSRAVQRLHFLDGAIGADNYFEDYGAGKMFIASFLGIYGACLMQGLGNRPASKLADAKGLGGVDRLESSDINIAKAARSVNEIAEGNHGVVREVDELRGIKDLGALHGVEQSPLEGGKGTTGGSH
jgi:hypothetical protein